MTSTIIESISPTTTTVFKTLPTPSGIPDSTVIDGETLGKLEDQAQSFNVLLDLFFAGAMLGLFLVGMCGFRRWYSPAARRSWYSCWI
jgi:hypothetical protein